MLIASPKAVSSVEVLLFLVPGSLSTTSGDVTPSHFSLQPLRGSTAPRGSQAVRPLAL